jgi:hypothetical protein
MCTNPAMRAHPFIKALLGPPATKIAFSPGGIWGLVFPGGILYIFHHGADF